MFFSALSSEWIMKGKYKMLEYPLEFKLRSTETGGSLYAIDAYRDGVGVIIQGKSLENSVISNIAINTLVKKYGIIAKENSLNLSDQVLIGVNKIAPTVKDIEYANQILSDTDLSGLGVPNQVCDDGDVYTCNDKYNIEGRCTGGVSVFSCETGSIENLSSGYCESEIECSDVEKNFNGIDCVKNVKTLDSADETINYSCENGVLEGHFCKIGQDIVFPALSTVNFSCPIGSNIVNGNSCEETTETITSTALIPSAYTLTRSTQVPQDEYLSGSGLVVSGDYFRMGITNPQATQGSWINISGDGKSINAPGESKLIGALSGIKNSPDGTGFVFTVNGKSSQSAFVDENNNISRSMLLYMSGLKQGLERVSSTQFRMWDAGVPAALTSFKPINFVTGCATGELVDGSCVSTTVSAIKTAAIEEIVYSCSEGVLFGTQCVVTNSEFHPAIESVTYSCQTGVLEGNQCEKTNVEIGGYVCNIGSVDLVNSMCVSEKTITCN